MAAREKHFQKREVAFARLKEALEVGKRVQADPKAGDTFDAHYDRLETVYATFEESHLAVSVGVTDEVTKEVNKRMRQEADSVYFEIVAMHKRFQRSRSQETPQIIADQPQIRLPKINLPVFNGEFKLWPTFYELFTSMIHENSKLSKLEKFHYLMSSLTGEPKSLLKAITVSDVNYLDAYKTLVERYQNRRKLAFAYWEELQGLHVKGSTAKELRRVLDIFSENVNMLKNLGFAVNNWDFILFHTLLVKLDSNLRQRFERSCGSEDIPSYKSLIEFLQTECLSLELSGTCNVSSTGSKRRVKGDPASSFFVNTKGESSSCRLCRGNHTLTACEKFLEKDTGSRRQFILRQGLCLMCFQGGHRANNCQGMACENCNRKHHTLLHFPKSMSRSENGVEPVTALTNATRPSAIVLLATAVVEVQDRFGTYQPVRVLLDSGSQANFITRSGCQRLGLVPGKSRVSVLGLGKSPSLVTSLVSCVVRSQYRVGVVIALDALVLQTICGHLPVGEINAQSWSFLQGLHLADPRFASPGRIDLLLGADVFCRALTGRRKEGRQGEPVALETSFGWCLLGEIKSQFIQTEPLVLHAVIDHHLEELVQQFWRLDDFGEETDGKGLTDKIVDQYYRDTVYRDPVGRFSVALPFRTEKPWFVGSYDMAVRRFLSLEKRLVKDPDLYQAYQKFMEDYLESGHMSLVVEELRDEGLYYIPHHPVIRPGSQTTKLRVVFDASAKARNGISLNDVLIAGPSLQRPIVAILLRFRLHAVCFIADIKQMYRQIEVRKEDRKYQRIVWRPCVTVPLQKFELNTVTYGLSASPFLAIRTLHELAKTGQEQYPRAARTLMSEVYMDDAVTGDKGQKEAKILQAELIQLLKAGQFDLRKWASNDPSLLAALDPSVENQLAVSFDKGEVPCIKVLGLQWQTDLDVFTYEVNLTSRECTKRNILSELARIFDPLGLLCPVTFLAKALIQQLWVLGLAWDDPVPEAVQKKWVRVQQELGTLAKVQVPRYVLTSEVIAIQLHGFSDASELGYAAAIYVRATRCDHSVTTNLLLAKTKVAPLRQRSIPRLELCAAVLLTDLLKLVQREGNSYLRDAETVAWSDSMVVLAWLRSQSHRYKPFVGNRIGHIQEALSPNTFRYVPSEYNPADVASRGALPAELVQHKLWWKGPPWLAEDCTEWPKMLEIGSRQGEDPECKASLSLVAVKTEVIAFVEQFSTLRRLQYTVGWCCRFWENCRRKKGGLPKLTGPLSFLQLTEGLYRIIRQVQQCVFALELDRIQRKQRLPKALQALNIFVDPVGLLRVGGRLEAANVKYAAKFPILLPRKHVLTDLIIDDCHQKYLHPGLQTVHFLLRQNYWILSPKRAIRSRITRCVKCFRANPRPCEPLMGNLPPSRVLEAKAFMKVGIDFGGPFLILPVRGRGRKPQKMYVCVFVCHATKAIHIELVFDLTADAFIAALRRFVARRGHCRNINCDRGTNFVGASRQLGRLLKEASIFEGIKFEFNPPRTPHFGGLFEAGIKSIKTHLQRVVGTQTLTVEEFLTLLN